MYIRFPTVCIYDKPWICTGNLSHCITPRDGEKTMGEASGSGLTFTSAACRAAITEYCPPSTRAAHSACLSYHLMTLQASTHRSRFEIQWCHCFSRMRASTELGYRPFTPRLCSLRGRHTASTDCVPPTAATILPSGSVCSTGLVNSVAFLPRLLPWMTLS